MSSTVSSKRVVINNSLSGLSPTVHSQVGYYHYDRAGIRCAASLQESPLLFAVELPP